MKGRTVVVPPQVETVVVLPRVEIQQVAIGTNTAAISRRTKPITTSPLVPLPSFQNETMNNTTHKHTKKTDCEEFNTLIPRSPFHLAYILLYCCRCGILSTTIFQTDF